MSATKGLQIEDLRSECEKIRLNFLGGTVTFYDSSVSAWAGAGKFFISRVGHIYTATTLLEATRLLLWCLRAEQ